MIVEVLIASGGLALLVAVSLVDGKGKVDNPQPVVDVIWVVVLSFLAFLGFYGLSGLSG